MSDYPQNPTNQNDPWTQNPPAGRASAASGDETWARTQLAKLANAAVLEQRRARRWGIFFKLLTFAYLSFILWMTFQSIGWDGSGISGSKPHTAVVSVVGQIAEGKDASAGKIISGLRAAFEDKNTAGIILRINSPGGSPVQAGLVYDEIMRLRKANPDIPLHAVIGDLCASGGYYIAAATQNIYADKASLIGSIGVITSSFGFVDVMEKVGVERRLYTAGENKALLDPFSPSRPEEVAYFQGLLGEIHEQFITAVKDGRGDRLKDDPDLFSGLVWSGQKSVELGLIDSLGSVRYVAEEIIGEKELVNFTPRSSYLEKLLTSMGRGLGQVLGQSLQLEGGLR